MIDRFCGIDPPALGDLALQLEWIAADVNVQAGRAYGRLTRRSRWESADRVGAQLAYVSRWARTSSDDLRQRAGAMILAQDLNPWSPTLIGDSRWRWLGPLPRPGPIMPGFPNSNSLHMLAGSDIPWDQIEDWVRGSLGIWNGRQDDTFPMGRWVTGLLYVNRVATFLRKDGPIPTIAKGLVMRRLADTRYLRWVNNPVVQTVGRRVSIGLSAYSTVSDAIVVYNHGNPIDAFERDGAGYVADVARLGFSASTTAFLVAPNPVTGGLVIVTGVVWAGAEVVDHWDEITEFWGDSYADLERGTEWLYDQTSEIVGQGWDWTTDRADDGVHWVDDRLDEARDWAGDQTNAIEDWTRGLLDNLSRGWDWTADFVSDRVDEGLNVGEEIADGFVTAADYAGDRLDDARDWTGDRIDDLVDVGGGIVDGGIDIGKKLIPGW